MKTRPALLFLLIITGVVCSCSSQQQISNRDSKIAQLIDEQTYTFVAQSVLPTEDSRYNVRNMFPNSSANLYQLTSRYDLKITQDSVIAYLPFFGRAYTAPVDPSKGGIQFTSTKFSYKKTMRKGSYEIDIRPKDNNDIQALYLTVSPSGYASLRITSLNKTPISYNGVIGPNKQNK
ncbi:hypothetical protein A8C56_13305 [Niabella ginsenosidivorans]|uniref:DUF4251 domain-containing protein n=1 Tax=Niabella ginsenosidivorans TaxID=1176587 RepID=A0A1A9I3C0_9BACT|nr:DUF4251 domain-containing protein [Niabella ginsenosidivorans]ANH81825.1 hypothetical protein A8C56_13305 [Niabella ginsenosidivorans]